MKSVFMIGDSIRVGATNQRDDGKSSGYGIFVKESLQNVAEMYQPSENCRFAQYTLRYLHEWAAAVKNKEEVAVVYWNNGLWDVLRLFGDEPFTDIDFYGRTLVRIYHRIKLLFPNARIAFALSTSVKEEWASADFTRRNSDIELYNNKAIEVLSPLVDKIDDLYSVTCGFDDSMRVDWVHYNDDGSRILADVALESIKELL